MLKVKTRIGPSQIEGLGLFAAEAIPKGTVVWALDERFDTRIPFEHYEAAPAIIRDHLWRYAWRDEVSWINCGDDGRFINHSSTPNLGVSGSCESRAVRDIAEGEELTEDYGVFDIDFHQYKGVDWR